MAYIDLDKVINITGGGSAGTYPDGSPYPVLAQSIGLFNKEDARDAGNSEGWMGLLYSNNDDINTQNYNWNSQYSPAIFQGTGALSAKVKSYAFSADIDTVDGGKVVTGLFVNPAGHSQDYTSFAEIEGPSCNIKLDTTNNKILSAISNTNLPVSDTEKKAYLVEAGGNYFVVILDNNQLTSYPANSSGEITGPLISSQTMPVVASSIGAGNMDLAYCSIAGTNGSTIFLTAVSTASRVYGSGNETLDMEESLSGFIFDIDSAGTFSEAGKTHSLKFESRTDTGTNDSDPWTRTYEAYGAGSYFAGTDVHSYIGGVFGRRTNSSNDGTHMIVTHAYIIIDTTNTTTFTFSSIRAESKNSFRGSNIGTAIIEYMYIPIEGHTTVGFSGTEINVVRNNKHIIEVNSTGITDTTSIAYPLVYNDSLRYKNTVAKLTTESNNATTNSTGINIKGVAVQGTFNLQNAIWIYHCDGILEEDDENALKYIVVNTTVQTDDIAVNNIDLTLNINTNLVETKQILFHGAQTGNRINTNGPTLVFNNPNVQFTSFGALGSIGSSALELELTSLNVGALDLKLGFNLTGGDYTTPTGANDLSAGPTPSPRSPGANATYLNLTLTA